ncbi:MAG: geranylgeranylglycerol-phosphate geranylgeranyltransferase [Chitinophagales bacterium]|nr:geranylgeranylglycerol-phosphate geranylgeranyltransferase [Chitinophagales bacterium]
MNGVSIGILSAYARLVRLPNLLIVALTQFFIYYSLLLPALSLHNLSPLLDDWHFALFVLVTLIITAGGNIINDIVDCQIDLINRPQKVVIDRVISKFKGYQLYWGILLIGLLLSVYLAIHVGNIRLVIIYPIAVTALHFYSISFKQKVLVGNLLIAVFCAGVAGIVWFAERQIIEELGRMNSEIASRIQLIFIWYMVFAFLSTLYREIVKDLEDLDGDQAAYRTFPVVHGEKKAKVFALTIGLALLVFIIIMILKETYLFSLLAVSLMILLVCLPLLYTIYKLLKANNTSQYRHVSQWIKGIMLGGLMVLLAMVLNT